MSDRPFNPAELAENPDFVKWVLRPDPIANARWQPLANHPPERAERMAQARALVLFLHQPEPVSHRQIDADWQRLQGSMMGKQPIRSPDTQLDESTTGSPFVIYRNHWTRTSWAVAASVALLLLAGGAWWRLVAFQETRFSTQSGQTRVLTLTDGSRVTLNANSQLRTQTDWRGQFSREVWLTGEGFFEIQKTDDKQRFVVHTPQTEVEVLGTKFNVLTRRALTNVVLHEGRVRLRLADHHPALTLTPGDWVQVANQKTTRRRVRAEQYSAWMEKRFVFEGTPVADVLQTLEDRYGFRVQLANPLLAQRTYTGILPMPSDGTVLLRAVAETYGLRLTQTDSTYILR